MGTVNTKELKKRMIDVEVSVADLAKAINKKPVTVRQKLENYRPLFLWEAEVFQELLKIPDEDFTRYFFNRALSDERVC